MHSTELETQQLINSLNTALVMVDNKLTIVYANHAGEALFETGLKQLIGHPLQDFFLPGTIETIADCVPHPHTSTRKRTTHPTYIPHMPSHPSMYRAAG